MDLLLKETGNGGDLILVGNDLAKIEGFENMPYCGLFGGNVKQSTGTRLKGEQAFDFWANSLLFPNDKSIQFNSLTERALNEIPLTSSGRIKIEQQIKKDLEFFNVFAELKIVTEIIATDVLKIALYIKEPDNLQAKEFIYIWEKTKGEVTVEEVNNKPVGLIDFWDDDFSNPNSLNSDFY